MPGYIKHRVNRIADLKEVDISWGVEIDLRSNVGRPQSIHLSHDPWTEGDSFADWLAEFSIRKIQGPIILNTKEDGLEDAAVEALNKFDLKNYFFLDTAYPTLIKWVIKKQKRYFAARLSTYEKHENLKLVQGRLDWIWVDCFDAKPISKNEVADLKKDFKLVLVSPELQGASIDKMAEFQALGQSADFICTKNPIAWQKIIAGSMP